MPDFIMLIGHSGSGKDTYIESINTSDKNYLVLSRRILTYQIAKKEGKQVDEIVRSIGVYDYNKELLNLVSEGFEAKRNIALNKTFSTPLERSVFLSQVPSEYKKIGVYFKIPHDVLLDRLKKLEAETGIRIPPESISAQNTIVPPQYGEFDEVITIDENWSP